MEAATIRYLPNFVLALCIGAYTWKLCLVRTADVAFPDAAAFFAWANIGFSALMGFLGSYLFSQHCDD
jgi:hypothetical protein